MLLKKSVIVIGLAATACCPCDFETPPPVDFSEGKDTTYLLATVPAAQLKNVLIEDFTGVRCPNCPKAHEEIVAIQNAHAGRVLTMSLHPKNSVLTQPYTQISGFQDFRTDEATQIYSNLGSSNGLPAGATDRNLFTGQTALLNTSPTAWSSFVTQQLVKSTPVNIEIENNYDPASRQLVITAKAIVNSGQITDSLYMTVAILESGMVNPQEDHTFEVDTFYVHNNVLRKVVTAFNGSQLTGNPIPGKVYQKGFTETLPPLWNADKCKVMVWVHRSGTNKEVWHVAERAVK